MPHDTTIPYGFCKCGCGRRTRISPRTSTIHGYKAGEPVGFILGHKAKPRHEPISAAPFKIDGVYCRLIALTQRQYAIVWESDYEWLSSFKWHARWSKGIRQYYAARSAVMNGKNVQIPMHREILGLSAGSREKGDHVRPGETTDNRRANLRVATREQNAHNSRISKNNRSGFKGIYYIPHSKMYGAHITSNGIKHYLGCRKLPEDAHALYCDAAQRLNGQFARTK